MKDDPIPYAARPVAYELECAYRALHAAGIGLPPSIARRLDRAVMRSTAWICAEGAALDQAEAELVEAHAALTAATTALRDTSSVH